MIKQHIRPHDVLDAGRPVPLCSLFSWFSHPFASCTHVLPFGYIPLIRLILFRYIGTGAPLNPATIVSRVREHSDHQTTTFAGTLAFKHATPLRLVPVSGTRSIDHLYRGSDDATPHVFGKL